MISRSWSVLAVWTLGRGLPEVEAISGAIPLPPSLPYSHLYRSPTLRHLFHSLAAGPSILCSFYACVSTCPEWPSSCERRTLENRTHTEVLAYRRPLPFPSPSLCNCIQPGVLPTPLPSTWVVVYWCLELTLAQTNCASCIHLVIGLHSGICYRYTFYILL